MSLDQMASFLRLTAPSTSFNTQGISCQIHGWAMEFFLLQAALHTRMSPVIDCQKQWLCLKLFSESLGTDQTQCRSGSMPPQVPLSTVQLHKCVSVQWAARRVRARVLRAGVSAVANSFS